MDSYQELANAIVKLAATDYLGSLKALKKNPKNRNAMSTANECERFFTGTWFETLTDVDGNWLMKRLQEEVD